MRLVGGCRALMPRRAFHGIYPAGGPLAAHASQIGTSRDRCPECRLGPVSNNPTCRSRRQQMSLMRCLMKKEHAASVAYVRSSRCPHDRGSEKTEHAASVAYVRSPRSPQAGGREKTEHGASFVFVRSSRCLGRGGSRSALECGGRLPHTPGHTLQNNSLGKQRVGKRELGVSRGEAVEWKRNSSLQT